jgi:hypothetical protein
LSFSDSVWWNFFISASISAGYVFIDHSTYFFDDSIPLHSPRQSSNADFIPFSFLKFQLLENLAAIAFERHEFDEAEALRQEGLSLAWKLDFGYAVAQSLTPMAATLAAKGHPERAVRLLGAAAAARERMGVTTQPVYRSEEERYLDALPDQLDEATFTAAWQAGRKMSLEEAVEYVLEILE